MAKLKIKKVELVAPIGYKDAVLSYLQKKRAVELAVPEQTDGMTAGEYSSLYSDTEGELAVIKEALAILDRIAPEKKPLTAKLEPRRDMTDESCAAMTEDLPHTLAEAEKLIALDRTAAEARADNIRLATRKDLLTPWLEADMPLEPVYTRRTAFLAGSVRKRYTREELLSFLAGTLPLIGEYEIQIVSSDEVRTSFLLFSLRDDIEELENALRDLGFVRAPSSDVSPSEEFKQLSEKMKQNDEIIASASSPPSDAAAKREKLRFAADCLTMKKDRVSALSMVSESSRIFYLTGYIAERDSKKLAAYCEEHFSAAVGISDPGEDEDVPVLLTNNAFASPLENITGMYSYPSKNDVDPTGVMAFFYYLLFGMMLSDAGYGLLMVLATGGVLLFKRNIEDSLKKSCRMYLFCGLSTTFWGTMYGSWFGDAPKVIAEQFLGKTAADIPRLLNPLWTDAVADIMTVLVVCFIFGLIHLFAGVLMKGVSDIKGKRYFDAFCDTVPTFLLIIGIAPVFFSLFLGSAKTYPADVTPLNRIVIDAIWGAHNALQKVSSPLMISGLVLVVLTGGRSSKSIFGKIGGGLYEVYNLFGGYLGDVLSYARLLALGLATGIIGQVMNMIGTIPKSPVLKPILFIVVFLIGHTINLAINLIGAYVHTNRLQYVEFFGKFYEGGGRAFVPLSANTEYYKFKEEK